MTNITIGIIAKDKNIDNINYQVISKNNIKYIHNKCNYIAILNYDNRLIDTEILNKCDGIIFQGGNDIYPYHFQILKYCINNNIPVLGICMGHQIIGLYSTNSENEDDLIKVDNHNDVTKFHKITTNKESALNQILGDIAEVNTRHEYAIKNVSKPFKVTAVSEDNIIEGIEYIDDNHFVIGVQFHPEDLKNTENLYNYFIKEIIIRKNQKQNNIST